MAPKLALEKNINLIIYGDAYFEKGVGGNLYNISGFVNSEESFDNHPEVINGASDLITDIFGSNGKHSRIAVGCNSLPKNSCVEISSIFFIDN